MKRQDEEYYGGLREVVRDSPIESGEDDEL